MGINRSRFSYLSYEDACKRVSESELKRLKEAYKRYAGVGSLSVERFMSDVLGGFVPSSVASELFKALKNSTSSGLTFKELLVGLVLITKGKPDEKKKFLFSIFCNDSGTYIEKSTFEESLTRVQGCISSIESQMLFKNTDRATWDQFREWLSVNPAVTPLFQWLLIDSAALSLTDDSELPTFYQTLAGVTHLTEEDIVLLERRYWSFLSGSTNQFDLNTFQSLISPPIPAEVVLGLFRAFDENSDGHIDLKELACGISACCQGPWTERQKFCFKVFDSTSRGQLEQEDVSFMLQQFNRVEVECTVETVKLLSKEECDAKAADVIQRYGVEKKGFLDKEEYIIWTLKDNSSEKFLSLLHQVCVVVLSLKPRFREEEKSVVLDWLTRFQKHPLQAGGRVFLISKVWWSQWLTYVSYKPQNTKSSPDSSTSNTSIGKTSSVSSHRTQNGSSTLSSHSFSAGRGKSQVHNSPSASAPQPLTAVPGRPSNIDNSSLLTTLPPKLQNLPTLTDEGGILIGCGPRAVVSAPTSSNHSSLTQSKSTTFSSTSDTSSSSPVHQNNSTSTVTGDVISANGTTSSSTSSTSSSCLLEGRDYELLPEPLWQCLLSWYGGPGPALPRNIILASVKVPGDSTESTTQEEKKVVKVELDPLLLRIVRHVPATTGSTGSGGTGAGSTMSHLVQGLANAASNTSVMFSSATSDSASSDGSGRGFTKVVSNGVNAFFNMPGGLFYSSGSYSPSTAANGGYATANQVVHNPPKRQVTHRVCFSRSHTIGQIATFLAKQFRSPDRDSIRLWLYRCEDGSQMMPLEDDSKELGTLPLYSDQSLLLVEQRNMDLTWPEELCQLARSRTLSLKRTALVPGVTGLTNLGNTCFFNSALQCVSNTRPLTTYFTEGLQVYELNRDNINNTRGLVAQRYAELVKEMWSGSTALIAPLKLKLTIEKYATQFSGSSQHDSQELLAFFLDGLHEDLNRVRGSKPYKELPDSDGRHDEEVAQEVWEAHIARNHSIIVDLFHGLLRSQVRCRACRHVSVTFDPFSVLSLPLPMESNLEVDLLVFNSSGREAPVQHAILLPMESTYADVKEELAQRLNVSPKLILLAFVESGRVKTYLNDSDRVLRTFGPQLCAYVTRSGLDGDPPRVVMAYHRKLVPNSFYFLANCKISQETFGVPVCIPVQESASIRNCDMYEAVWQHVARLTDGPVRGGGSAVTGQGGNSSLSTHNPVISNHALDGDGMQLAYPFQLKHIAQDGVSCSRCAWNKFCRGCFIPCDDGELVTSVQNDTNVPSASSSLAGLFYVAIDWETTALHLRYLSSKEREFTQHKSVQATRDRLREPMSLHTCLMAFTREEDLDQEERYSCSKCKGLQLASKKLDLWKLPPVLIFHLKRFQHVHDRWQKSLKIVHFPLEDLNLSEFLQREKGDDATNELRYNLYAIACHGGSLQYGHYVVYAKNPNGKWYLFNDSICKEVSTDSIDMNAAYLLFYEQNGLDYTTFMPDVSGRVADTGNEGNDEVESDLKRLCVIQ